MDLRTRGVRVSATVAILAIAVAACGDDKGGGGAGGGDKKQIALLLPESKTARYEAADRPLFEAKVKALCSECEIIYSNADQDVTKQQQQAEAALTAGADVLVLDPVDSEAAAAIVLKAKAKKVPVISYDRLIVNADVDYYISFDNEKVGKLQAEALVSKLKEDGKTSGNIVMINGAPTDNNAKLFKAGAQSVLDQSGFTIDPVYDTPDWSPDKAQQQMDQAITAVGKDKIVGVYAANDGTGGGAIAAMKSAGINPLPPVTGQDAELAAIQRIIAGEQFMTVYKAIKPEAEKAAEMAVALARGEKFAGADKKVNNKTKDVDSVLLDPIAVTKDNIKDTIIKDEFHKVADICSGQYAAACSQAGIS